MRRRTIERMGLVIGPMSFVVVLGLIRISNSIFYFMNESDKKTNYYCH